MENENRKESRKEHPPPLPKKVFFAFVLFLFIYKFIYFSLLNSAICLIFWRSSSLTTFRSNVEDDLFHFSDLVLSTLANVGVSFEQNVVSEELRQKIIYFC